MKLGNQLRLLIKRNKVGTKTETHRPLLLTWNGGGSLSTTNKYETILQKAGHKEERCKPNFMTYPNYMSSTATQDSK